MRWRASAGVDPALTGTRSRTTGNGGHASNPRPLAGRTVPGRPSVSRRVAPSSLDCRTRRAPAAAGRPCRRTRRGRTGWCAGPRRSRPRTLLDVPVDLGGDVGRRPDEPAAGRHRDDELADGEVLGLGAVAPRPHECRHVPGGRARPRVIAAPSRSGSTSGSGRPRRTRTGRGSHLLEERDGRGRADLARWIARARSAASAAVSPRTKVDAGRNVQLVLRTADALEARRDVVVVGLRVVELGVQREDHLGVRRGEVAPLVESPACTTTGAPAGSGHREGPVTSNCGPWWSTSRIRERSANTDEATTASDSHESQSSRTAR